MSNCGCDDMAPEAILEGDNAILEGYWIDTTGAAFTPASLQYRVDDLASQQQLQDWTDLPVTGTSTVLVIPGALNALLSPQSFTERRQVKVRLTDSAGNKQTVPAVYEIQRTVGAQVSS